MNLDSHSIFDASMDELGSLLDEAASGQGAVWTSRDHAAVLLHQLAAPLRIDLANAKGVLADRLKLLAESEDAGITTFGELLLHENPPVELLTLAKEFAKTHIHSEHAAIPHDVAVVLYFSTIAAALCHAGVRITTLDDSKLADGLKWCLARDWLEPSIRQLLMKAEKEIAG